jgi:chromosome partitioning protein
MEESRLVPVTEMARRLGVTRERVRQMILEGKLEAVRLGHFWYVRKGGRVRLRRVFTFLTHAGSAGKTSLARDLGYELARIGWGGALGSGGNQRQGSGGSGRCHRGGAGVPRGPVEAN